MAGKDDKIRLMVKVAKMNHVYGLSQKSIAERLGISRGYVCQLLDAAREQGIVRVTVNDPLQGSSELEQHLCSRFGLRKAVVAEVPQGQETAASLSVELVGEANAALEAVLQSGSTIAFSWGRTVYQIAMGMRAHPGIRGVYAVPLCGGTSNLDKNIYVSEISTGVARAYNGTPLSIPLPVLLESAAVKQAVCSDASVRSVLDRIGHADVALFTVGEFGEGNSIYLGGYLDDEMLRSLTERGAVGDLFAHFINKDGEVCDPALDERTVSVSLQDFAAIPNKICVAAGAAKAEPLLGVLAKGYVDVLITSEHTVSALLKLM